MTRLAQQLTRRFGLTLGWVGVCSQDMAEYNAGGNIAGGVKQQLTDLTSKYFNGSAQLHMIAPAVGLTEMPGHENASCGAVNGTLFPVLVSVTVLVPSLSWQMVSLKKR